jgi:4-hydroxybenzoyl-CoA reductase subunit beta
MSYSTPSTIAEAAQLANADRSFAFIAGGTDLMVRQSLGLSAAKHLIDLSRIPELRGITHHRTTDGETLSIGATTTLTELAMHPIIHSRFPALVEGVLSIATPPIRNSATVAGNLLCENRCIYYDQSEFWQTAAGGCLKCGSDVCIATGSTKHCYSVFISDLAPVLIVLGAHVEIVDAQHLSQNISAAEIHRTSKPVEWLYTGDGLGPHTLAEREIITHIVIHITHESEHKVFFKKIRPRESVDFTNLTIAMRRNDRGGIDVAASGIGPAPALLRHTRTEDAGQIASALLKQSQIIDNLSYQRPYRKEMLRESIAQGIAAL